MLWYPEVPSTNDLAAAQAERGADEGTIVMTDAQTAGRGRLGRVWASPPGAGLYISIVLRPPPPAVPLLTIAAGVAIGEGIQKATGLQPILRWPNDVYFGDRKVAGVLAEASSSGISGIGADARRSPSSSSSEPVKGQIGQGLHHVIVGIGINVVPAAYPPDIAGRATSLEGELRRPVDRGLLLAECLASLAARYSDLREGRAGAVMDGWRRRAMTTLGRPLRWHESGVVHEGVAEDLDETGALIVRTTSGRERIIAGEVSWV